MPQEALQPDGKPAVGRDSVAERLQVVDKGFRQQPRRCQRRDLVRVTVRALSAGDEFESSGRRGSECV